jgi:short-subunit dehydrogenase involved in D-alanine esterification of teichoic acids
MSRWTTTDLIRQDGRTVIITGGSRGLGLITARELARAGARVVLAVRDPTTAAAVAHTLPGQVEIRQLDVSDLSSVRHFAEQWSGDVDVLVNNAGIMDVPLSRTADGFESQAATNYLGPFALTNLLLPHLTDRVVSVTSQLHRQGNLHLDDLAGQQRPYRPMDAYRRDSKLALVLFSTELQRRLNAASSPVRTYLAHPGIADTSLASHSRAGKVTHPLRFLFNNAEQGALPILFAATQPLPNNAYIGPTGPGGLRGFPAISKTGPATLRLHERGNTVIIGGRRREVLDQIRGEHPNIHTIVIDTSDATSVAAAAAEVTQRFPTIDVLVAMAGIMLPEDLHTAALLPTAEATVATNLLGPIRLIAAFTESLTAQTAATIITVSSGLDFVPLPLTPTYSATKAAIHSFTESLRIQLADTGVQVIELVPPGLRTTLMGQQDSEQAMPVAEFLDEMLALLKHDPEATEILVDRVKPLRFAEADGHYPQMLGALSGHQPGAGVRAGSSHR